jgi:ankyrin repeat protein
MSISSVIDTASNPSKLADCISEQGLLAAIDLEGNTIAHVVAALGINHSLQSILNEFPEQVLKRNDNGETLLYKACQAGHMDILRILRDTGIELTSIATLKEKATPLHWLFTFKDGCLSEACEYLMGPNRENINAQMVPETSSSSTYHPNNFPMLH